jgi:hypothetical protein
MTEKKQRNIGEILSLVAFWYGLGCLLMLACGDTTTT